MATYGMPHASTWNIGVIGMYTSSRCRRWPVRGEHSVVAVVSACSTIWRWLYDTPLGSPVVPVV
ncbi:hypothetical protein D3C81_1036270 [compost metagenome]